MRKRYPVILFIMLFPLIADVPVGAIHIFPDSSTKAFGNGWIRSIAYSPDGELLAIAGAEGIFLYDPVTLSQVDHFAADLHAIITIAFSPDGKWLASGGNDAIVRLWEVGPRQEIGRFKGHNYGVNSVDFSADGAFLVSSSAGGTVRVWDLQKRRQIEVLDTENVVGVPPSQALFSPVDSLIAVATNSGKIIFWDIETKKINHIIDLGAFFPSITFSANGKMLLSTDFSGHLRFWNVETGKLNAVRKDTMNQSIIAIPNRGFSPQLVTKIISNPPQTQVASLMGKTQDKGLTLPILSRVGKLRKQDWQLDMEIEVHTFDIDNFHKGVDENENLSLPFFDFANSIDSVRGNHVFPCCSASRTHHNVWQRIY